MLLMAVSCSGNAVTFVRGDSNRLDVRADASSAGQSHFDFTGYAWPRASATSGCCSTLVDAENRVQPLRPYRAMDRITSHQHSHGLDFFAGLIGGTSSLTGRTFRKIDRLE
jgi:hypothetical protein